FTDQDGGTPAAGLLAGQYTPRRIPKAQGELGIDRGPAHFTAHTVRTEIFALSHKNAPFSIANHTLSASTVSATSCTRKNCAPRATPANAAATLPETRSAGVRPITWPIMDLRDRPTSQGKPWLSIS